MLVLLLINFNFSGIFIYSQVIIRGENTNDDSVRIINLLLGKWVTIDRGGAFELIRDTNGDLWEISFSKKKFSNRYYIDRIDKVKMKFKNKDSLKYFYYIDDKDTGYFFDVKDLSDFIVSWKYISKVSYNEGAKLHYYIYECENEDYDNWLGADVFLCAVSKNDLLLVSARGRYLTYVRPKKRMKFIYDKWYKW
jgi:hypothetical protein